MEYFEYSLTVSTDSGVVPAELENYHWAEPQLKLFLAAKYEEMDFVSPATGFLGIDALRLGVAYGAHPTSQHYVVAACLTGVGWFGERLAMAKGYPSSPRTGLSFSEFVTFQLGFIADANAFDAAARDEWLTFADTEFRVQLRASGALELAIMGSSRPVDGCLDYFVPPDSRYVRSLSARRAQAAPVALVRRAFPSLYKAAPVVLPGIAHVAAPAVPLGNGLGPGGGQPGKVGKTKKKKKGAGDGEPGSKASYATVLSPTSLFLCGFVYDVGAIAAASKCNVEDKCWPVLLTTKEGEAALQLCPDLGAHGGVDSDCHTAPSGFKAGAMRKSHSKKATPTQCKAAGWQTFKK